MILKKIFEKLTALQGEIALIRQDMERYLPTCEILLNKKKYMVTKFYADSPLNADADEDTGLCALRLQIFLGAPDWYRIQSQPFYRELMEYLDSL